MKITLMQGSPHKQGSASILAEQFQAGASQNGHEIVVFDTAQAQIAPCLACEYCHTKGNGNCCQKDDMENLKELILSSEMVVIATPLYFFNMSAQMKAAVDRLWNAGTNQKIRFSETCLRIRKICLRRYQK